MMHLLNLSSDDMEALVEHREKLDAELELLRENRMELETEIEEKENALNIIDFDNGIESLTKLPSCTGMVPH